MLPVSCVQLVFIDFYQTMAQQAFYFVLIIFSSFPIDFSWTKTYTVEQSVHGTNSYSVSEFIVHWRVPSQQSQSKPSIIDTNILMYTMNSIISRVNSVKLVCGFLVVKHYLQRHNTYGRWQVTFTSSNSLWFSIIIT